LARTPFYGDSTIEAGYVQDGTMTFAGANATFIIDHATAPGFPGGTLADFGQTDVLDLRDITAGSAALLGYSGTPRAGP